MTFHHQQILPPPKQTQKANAGQPQPTKANPGPRQPRTASAGPRKLTKGPRQRRPQRQQRTTVKKGKAAAAVGGLETCRVSSPRYVFLYSFQFLTLIYSSNYHHHHETLPRRRQGARDTCDASRAPGIFFFLFAYWLCLFRPVFRPQVSTPSTLFSPASTLSTRFWHPTPSSTYHHATNIPRPVFDTPNPFFNLPPCMHPPLPTIANEGQCRPTSSQQRPLLDPSGKRVYDYSYTCFLIYSILETHVRSRTLFFFHIFY
jgi:hypothetical protein